MNQELYHFGVKGMKWGHRKARPVSSGNAGRKKSTETPTNDTAAKETRNKKIKRAVAVGAAAAGATLAVYGGYKLNKYLNSSISKKHLETGRAYMQYADMQRRLGDMHIDYAEKGKLRGSGDFMREQIAAAQRSRQAASAAENKGREYLRRAQQGGYSLSEKTDYIKELYKNRRG